MEYPLRDGERIEELVGDDDRWTRAGCEAAAPAHRHLLVLQGCALDRLEHGVALDQLYAQCGAKRRHEARRAQHVEHQCAASGAKLDEPQRRRRPHLLPDDGAPQPDDLAEHLADLGRGNEIAAAADGRPASVVAMLGILQARLHVVGDADRSIARDARRQLQG